VSRRPVWEEIYKRFDPFHPVVNPAWRAPRPASPANEIIRVVSVPFGEPRALVTGTIGTGKSTELLRIAETRSGHDFVVVLDLVRHFSEVVGDEQALRSVEVWEVVFLAGLAVVRASNEVLPYPIPDGMQKDLSRAWERVARATETPLLQGAQVDVGGLSKAMSVVASAAQPFLGLAPGAAAAAAVGLKALEAAGGALKWNLPLGQAARRKPDQDVEMQSLLHAVNAIIGYVQTKATRILLVIDGLDRILDLERAEALFLRSEMIAQLACRLIVTGPFSLRSHPAASAIPRFSEVVPIVNEPVMDKHDPRRPGPGVAFFSEVFRRRTHDLGVLDLVPQALLDQLAYHSGGRARDFVKSIRSLAEQAWLDDVPSATKPLVDKVLDKMRRLLETGLDEGHIEALERVMKNPLHRLPGDDKARDLLMYGQLLRYPNETEWYYPHPLLLMHLLRASTSSANGSG
jgi:hypothetical protein